MSKLLKDQESEAQKKNYRKRHIMRKERSRTYTLTKQTALRMLIQTKFISLEYLAKISASQHDEDLMKIQPKRQQKGMKSISDARTHTTKDSQIKTYDTRKLNINR